MKFFSDLHMHSRYARACSKDLRVETLEKWAAVKGINLLGTGDFTHPLWLKELKEKLKPAGSGFFQFENRNIFFSLTAEVSLIYNDGKALRRVHHVLTAPSFEVVEQINDFLGKKGKLASDGRPIIGKLPSTELVEKCMEISKDILVIPAHAWTPWFALFGSKSGFDSLKECFEDQTKNIFAIETGMSSDPAMNWRLSQLDNVAILSNSDSHSYWPWRMGREANVFDLSEPSYFEMLEAIKKKDPKKFLYTIEVDPGYGKYHVDGHRACGIQMEPAEALKLKNICPVCKKELTIGVLHRVEELADRPVGFIPKGAIPFKTLLPLSELIAVVLGVQVASKKVWEEYNKLISRFGNEISVLLEADEKDLLAATHEKIAEIILKNRLGEIKVKPGFDGVYGTLVVDGKEKVLSGESEGEKSETKKENKESAGGLKKFLK